MIRSFARKVLVPQRDDQDMTGAPPEPAGGPAAAAGLPVITPSPQVVSRGTAMIVSAAAGLAFALLAVWIAARGSAVPRIDQELHSWAISHRGPASVTVARAVMLVGVTKIVLPALVVVGAATCRGGTSSYRRLTSGVLLSCIASAGVYAEIRVNALVGRARPPVTDWAATAGGPSFPSVHTTAATIFALSCAWALAARVPAGWPRRGVWAGAVIYAAAVGWSRVWLGVHWPTDVTAGWLFGLAWSAGSVAVVLTLRRRRGRAIPAAEA